MAYQRDNCQDYASDNKLECRIEVTIRLLDMYKRPFHGKAKLDISAWKTLRAVYQHPATLQKKRGARKRLFVRIRISADWTVSVAWDARQIVVMKFGKR
jgi:hypothetical protein